MPEQPTSRFEDDSPTDPRIPASSAPADAQYEVRDFEILSATPASPDDDPADWIHPEATEGRAELLELAGEIVRHDRALTSILSSLATRDVGTGELIRRVNAWQASMGGGFARSAAAGAPEPWMH